MFSLENETQLLPRKVLRSTIFIWVILKCNLSRGSPKDHDALSPSVRPSVCSSVTPSCSQWMQYIMWKGYKNWTRSSTLHLFTRLIWIGWNRILCIDLCFFVDFVVEKDVHVSHSHFNEAWNCLIIKCHSEPKLILFFIYNYVSSLSMQKPQNTAFTPATVR